MIPSRSVIHHHRSLGYQANRATFQTIVMLIYLRIRKKATHSNNTPIWITVVFWNIALANYFPAVFFFSLFFLQTIT
jgi:hypothetical protein